MDTSQEFKNEGRACFRLAVLASHPIQYQAPLFRALAARPEIDLQVYFCCRWGVESYKDPGFRVAFSWDIPLLKGYSYTFLPNLTPVAGPNRFLGIVNPGILAAVCRNQFDALWLHGWALASNWIGWLAAIPRHLPILLRAETNGLVKTVGLKKTAKRLVLNMFFSRVAGFLAIGTNNANFYKSYGVAAERVFWTPYAVDNDFFMEHARNLTGQRHLLREKEGIPSDLPLILFCGKFLEEKAPLDLLKAFASLGGRPKASLVFVGDGPLRPQMELFIVDQRLANVFFLGFRNQTELPACYAMADVLVLPSSFEPWGLVLNEAMCFELPIIASDQVGAAVDLVRQGVNGFIYPVGDVPALTDCLRKVLIDGRARQAMGRQSLAIISRWGLAEDVEGVLQALRAVTRQRG